MKQTITQQLLETASQADRMRKIELMHQDQYRLCGRLLGNHYQTKQPVYRFTIERRNCSSLEWETKRIYESGDAIQDLTDAIVMLDTLAGKETN